MHKCLLIVVVLCAAICARADGVFKVRDRAAKGYWANPEQISLKLDVQRSKSSGAEFFDVRLSDLAGKDRAVTLKYSVKIPQGKVTWFSDSRTSVTAPEEDNRPLGNLYHYGKVGSRFNSRFPLAALEHGGRARAIAVDNEVPAYYRIAYLPKTREFYIEYDFGLAHPEKNDAHVRFLVYDFDGRHGFRGALERFREIFPEKHTTRVKKHGSLLCFTNASTIPDPLDFGFRFKEGDYEPEKDDALGIYTLHYAEPCTWWMKLDGKDGRAQATIEEGFAEAEAQSSTNSPSALAWKSCAMKDADGKPIGSVQNRAWCKGILWNMNSAPGIKGEFTDWKFKVGNDAFDKRYASSEFPKGTDGEFIDSSEMYLTAPLDFDRSHFAAMETPLLFDSVTFKPGIFKGMISFEYCRELSRKVRGKNRIVMANGTPNIWSWNVQWIDAACWESGWLDRKDPSVWKPVPHERLLAFRTFLGDKPFAMIQNTDFDHLSHERVEKFMQYCLAYGFAPSFFSAASHGKKNKKRYFCRPELYERDRPLFKKYMPLCIAVSEAGWRPVNRLFPVDPATGIFAEQFGDRYVTLFNPSLTETLRIAVPEAHELTTGAKVGGELFLEPETCRVLDFKGPNEFTTVVKPLDGEKWWGGSVNAGGEMPYFTTKGEKDLGLENEHGAVAPFFVSSAGRYVWSDRPFRFSFKEGVLTVVSRYEKVEPVVAGKTLKEAYLQACRRHFPFDGRLPAELLFTMPQWNNWMEIAIQGMKQSSVDAYTDALAASGFPCGVYMMDGGWFSHMGSYAFHAEDYPDPKGMFDRIRKNGWKSMIWTAHFVSPDSREFKALRYGPGYMIQGQDVLAYKQEENAKLAARRRTAGVVWWWSGISAVYDLTYAPGRDCFVKTLKDFAAKYGIDGFKFDAGDTRRLCESVRFHDTAKEAVDYAHEYVKLGADNFPYNEYRCGYRTGGMPVMQRLHDQKHSWDAHGKVNSSMLAAGLLGSPYIVADMIGGGRGGTFRPGGYFCEKLFVRSCAQQALHPMMQFSAAPWRYLKPENVEICKAFANLHVEFGPYILELARHASRTGEPIMRSMEYEFPGQGFARAMSQFMLGAKWLVAPVVNEDDSLKVELPKGRWRDDLGEVHEGPKVLDLKDVPLARLPRYERI